jgi:antitoxin (DNA-binding transcriptional repressor) of toxin-antitoxin stability system
MVVVGSFFVVAGGIHLRVKSPSGAMRNTLFLRVFGSCRSKALTESPTRFAVRIPIASHRPHLAACASPSAARPHAIPIAAISAIDTPLPISSKLNARFWFQSPDGFQKASRERQRQHRAGTDESTARKRDYQQDRSERWTLRVHA